ncbi:MAG: ABC-type transport auxiliary lipoprotein family protein [Hylemonella sp.]|nr:ABC-type transport auxiliary lipoprotein family protein [Hylemonella sp.]
MKRVDALAMSARWSLLLMATLLTACALPERAPAPVRYDFGPPAVAPMAQPPAPRLVLALRVQASPALDGPAMLYRLGYADAQQLRAYSQSRWTMTPAELVQQRLREGLGQEFMLTPGDVAPRLLLVELEEFSQIFSSPEQSAGLLRLRATLLQRTPGGEQLLAQREVQVQQAASSADAAGGVRALGAATDAAVTELVQWLQRQR